MRRQAGTFPCSLFPFLGRVTNDRDKLPRPSSLAEFLDALVLGRVVERLGLFEGRKLDQHQTQRLRWPLEGDRLATASNEPPAELLDHARRLTHVLPVRLPILDIHANHKISSHETHL